MPEAIQILTIRPSIYRLYSIPDNAGMTVSAQDLLDIMDYALQHTTQLKQEASQAQEYEDTQKYIEHHYLGGE